METNRRLIAESLYKAAYSFFKTFYKHGTYILFKEVHVHEHYRVDLLNLSWDDSVQIIELKSCREDFLADHKWENYLNYCNKFWFMCPKNVILPEELPKNIGLIWVNDAGVFDIRKKAYKLKGINLTNEWFRKIYKRLAFRKFGNLKGQVINLEDLDLFR